MSFSKDLLVPASPSQPISLQGTRPKDFRRPPSIPRCPTREDEDEAGSQAPDDRDDFADVRDEESQKEGQEEPADGLKQAPPPLPNHVLLHRHPGVTEPETLQDRPAGTDPGQGGFPELPLLPTPAPASSQCSPAAEMQDRVGRQHTEDDEGASEGNGDVVGGVGQQNVLLHTSPKSQEATDTCREGSSQWGAGTNLLHVFLRDQTRMDMVRGTSQGGLDGRSSFPALSLC